MKSKRYHFDFKEGVSMLRDRQIRGFSGRLTGFGFLAVLALSIWMLIVAISDRAGPAIVAWSLVQVVSIGCLFGLTVVNPNEAKVVQLFGVYKGSLKEQGFWWVNPLTLRRTVSLRVRNFESSRLKV